MEMRFISGSYRGDIKPWDVSSNLEKLEAMQALKDEHKAEVVAFFIQSAQVRGSWKGVYRPKREEPGRLLSRMVRDGILDEYYFDRGWVYELSARTIHQIHRAQTEGTFIERALQVLRGTPRFVESTQ